MNTAVKAPTRAKAACAMCNMAFINTRLFLNLQLMEYFCEDCVTPVNRRLTYGNHEVAELEYNRFVREQWFHENRDYMQARDFLFDVVKAGKFSAELYERYLVWSGADPLGFAGELQSELMDSLHNRLNDRRHHRSPDIDVQIRLLIAALRYVRPLHASLQRDWYDRIAASVKAFHKN